MLRRAALVVVTMANVSACLADNRQLGDVPRPSGGAPSSSQGGGISLGVGGSKSLGGSGGSGGSAGSVIVVGMGGLSAATNLCSGLSFSENDCIGAIDAPLSPLTTGGCEFALTIPPGLSFERDQVAVVFAPEEGPPRQVPRVNALSACALNPTGGWFYDRPDSSALSLCPCSCAEVDARTTLVALLGCTPTVGIR
jgi:hypothetical protein